MLINWQPTEKKFDRKSKKQTSTDTDHDNWSSAEKTESAAAAANSIKSGSGVLAESSSCEFSGSLQADTSTEE